MQGPSKSFVTHWFQSQPAKSHLRFFRLFLLLLRVALLYREYSSLIKDVTIINDIITFIFSEEKIYPNSRATDCGESAPWQAFWVPSVPYNALRLYGAYYRAFSEFVGPISFLHLEMASGAISSIPTAKSEVIKLMSF